MDRLQDKNTKSDKSNTEYVDKLHEKHGTATINMKILWWRIGWVPALSCGLNYSTSETCTEMSVTRQLIREPKFISLLFYEAECLRRMLLGLLRACFGWVTPCCIALFWGVWRMDARERNDISRQEAKGLFRGQAPIIT